MHVLILKGEDPEKANEYSYRVGISNKNVDVGSKHAIGDIINE